MTGSPNHSAPSAGTPSGTSLFAETVIQCLGILPPPLQRRWIALLPLLLLQAAVEWGAAASVYLFLAGGAFPSPAGWLPRLPSPPILLALFLLLKNALVIATARLEASLLADSMQTTFERLLRGYLAAPLAIRSQHHASDFSHAATDALDVSFRRVLVPAASLVTEAFVVAALVGVLLRRAPSAGLAAALLLGVALAVTLQATERAAVGAGQRRDALEADLLRDLGDVLRGATEIQALGREETAARAILERHETFVESHRSFAAVSTVSRPAVELVFVAGLMVAAFAVPTPSAGTLIPLLGLLAYATFRVMPAANRAVFCVNEIRIARPAVQRVRRDLAWFPAPAPGAGESVPAAPFRDRLTLEGVTVRPDPSRPPALEEVSLEIRQGEVVAIVGPTGSGKSTLLLVLAGLLEPDTGRVLVDGAPVSRAHRRRIAWVPQIPFLADDTLRRNVAFGLGDDEIDAARVDAAMEAARLGDFVRSLPEGLETRAGEAGILLSGGERQRLGIARALYAGSEILLLDEPTSALDLSTERELMDTLSALAPERTVVVASHRPAAVERAARVVLLERGRVAAPRLSGEIRIKGQVSTL